ncbi:MAG TPA: hypothetical protein VG326_05680 [Tepidisphaeraceae bacterium]|jgi:hypothetical protein|nr:hypothetical protein [Tepidisphaeraceae bacterium]
MDDLVEIQPMHGHVRPRLKVRFEMGIDGLSLVGPDATSSNVPNGRPPPSSAPRKPSNVPIGNMAVRSRSEIAPINCRPNWNGFDARRGIDQFAEAKMHEEFHLI